MKNVSFLLKISNNGFYSFFKNSLSVILFLPLDTILPASFSTPKHSPLCTHQAMKQKREKELYFSIFPHLLPLAPLIQNI